MANRFSFKKMKNVYYNNVCATLVIPKVIKLYVCEFFLDKVDF